ncbi:protein NDRG3-like isoform X5 [Artemia franciscana]|uniref:protein NDRG3-like isoform X5 n=1 Tax=Artemia franciscana TaxID=6661 RepID=UPI0032DA716E
MGEREPKYSSLGEDVYRSTTVPTTQSSGGVVDSFRRFIVGSSQPLSDVSEKETFIERGPLRSMPTGTPEETSLLRGVSADNHDVELKAVAAISVNGKSLAKNEKLCVEERVETSHGTVLVAVQGPRNKPAILTYHDLGLNHVANFQTFFNFSETKNLMSNFCIYHVNAPGQEEGAETLPEGFVYPTMDELSEQLIDVMAHFNLNRIIGLGAGVGANILARFAINYPEKVDGLILINTASTAAGWIEWGYQKLNARHLKSKGLGEGTLDYLMWHHFGRGYQERQHDLSQVYREYFVQHLNAKNLALFIDSYVQRSDLGIVRELDETKKDKVRRITVPVLNVVGAHSPHEDDTVTFNGRLDPTNSTWLKIQDCSMVLEEQPAKIIEAMRLFLQGLGFAVAKSQRQLQNLL